MSAQCGADHILATPRLSGITHTGHCFGLPIEHWTKQIAQTDLVGGIERAIGCAMGCSAEFQRGAQSHARCQTTRILQAVKPHFIGLNKLEGYTTIQPSIWQLNPSTYSIVSRCRVSIVSQSIHAYITQDHRRRRFTSPNLMLCCRARLYACRYFRRETGRVGCC